MDGDEGRLHGWVVCLFVYVPVDAATPQQAQLSVHQGVGGGRALYSWHGAVSASALSKRAGRRGSKLRGRVEVARSNGGRGAEGGEAEVIGRGREKLTTTPASCIASCIASRMRPNGLTCTSPPLSQPPAAARPPGPRRCVGLEAVEPDGLAPEEPEQEEEEDEEEAHHVVAPARHRRPQAHRQVGGKSARPSAAHVCFSLTRPAQRDQTARKAPPNTTSEPVEVTPCCSQHLRRQVLPLPRARRRRHLRRRPRQQRETGRSPSPSPSLR